MAGSGIFCWSICSVCKLVLMKSRQQTCLDMQLDQSLKELHNNQQGDHHGWFQAGWYHRFWQRHVNYFVKIPESWLAHSFMILPVTPSDSSAFFRFTPLNTHLTSSSWTVKQIYGMWGYVRLHLKVSKETIRFCHHGITIHNFAVSGLLLICWIHTVDHCYWSGYLFYGCYFCFPNASLQDCSSSPM